MRSQQNGKLSQLIYEKNYYNLDVVVSVGLTHGYFIQSKTNEAKKHEKNEEKHK